MKKLILPFAMFMTMAFAGRAQETTTQDPNDPNAPEITFETETIDYGTIAHGASGVREFKFKNSGKTPLIISSATGSCGCTTPEWPKEPIAPGASSVIKVKYDTQRVGNFTKTVTLTSNAKTSRKVLTIKGNIKSPEDAGTPKPAEGSNPK